MALPLDQQRAALDPWLAGAHDALQRRDWRAAFAGYPRLDLADQPIPWAAPPADPRSTRLTLVGSCGIYAPGQPPFDAANPEGDFSWRALAADLALDQTMLAHEHYDHGPALLDRNSVYPLARLRELVADGELGGLTPLHFSFMGYLPDWRIVMDRLAPELAERVAAQQPDAALLVPV
jgi:D-proline reductase (dithiol) PrdB